MKNNRIIFVLLSVAIGSILSCVSYGGYKSVNIEVIDEFEQKIEGVKVSVSFDNGGGKVRRLTKLTDVDGLASFSGRTPYTVPVIVEKEGYYFSRLLLDNSPEILVEKRVILRKKNDPRPMHAKSERYAFPVFEQRIGFDFEMGDWVAPYGKGISTDVFFLATTRLEDLDNYSFLIDISFPNQGDGVLLLENKALEYDSVFKFPYLAPDSGYQNNIRFSAVKKDGKESKNLSSIVLRIRSKVVNGILERANYVKLHPPITPYGLVREPGMDMTYYFNPLANNRSLEFDMTKNLKDGESRFGRTFSP